MAALYLYSGSIWPSIVLHAAIDLQAGAVAFEAFGRGGNGERGQEPVLLEIGS
jgi:membrane protease YdiL (CAAX protease family)